MSAEFFYCDRRHVFLATVSLNNVRRLIVQRASSLPDFQSASEILMSPRPHNGLMEIYCTFCKIVRLSTSELTMSNNESLSLINHWF